MTLALTLIGAYWLMLLATRWVFIAQPNRKLTRAEVQATRLRLRALGQLDDETQATLDLADSHLADTEESSAKAALRAVARFIWWSGSHELIAWRHVHGAERLAAEKLEASAVKARLAAARGTELGELPTLHQNHWRDELAGAERNCENDLAGARATLVEFLGDLYDTRDTKFANLAAVQNKVTWLVMVALVLMVALVAEDFEQVLLAGAIGGLLSRLQRVLLRRDVPSDYGVSWAVLFLSPVAGAIAAWAGLHVIAALQELDVIDLTSFFDAAKDEIRGDPNEAILGLAVVLGFSERFLDRIVKSVQEKIDPAEKGA